MKTLLMGLLCLSLLSACNQAPEETAQSHTEQTQTDIMNQKVTASNKQNLAQELLKTPTLSQADKDMLSSHILRVSGAEILAEFEEYKGGLAGIADKHSDLLPEGKTPREMLAEEADFQQKVAAANQSAPTMPPSKPVAQATPKPLAKPAQPQTPTLVPLKTLAGNTADKIVQTLGQHTKEETVNPSGSGCPCPKRTYLKAGIEYEIVFINGKADWIDIRMPNYAKSLPLAHKKALSALGLGSLSPTDESESIIHYKPQGLIEVSVFKEDDGPLANSIYIKVATD